MLNIRLFSAASHSRNIKRTKFASIDELEQLVNKQIETAEKIGLGEAISAVPVCYTGLVTGNKYITVMVCFKTKT